MEIEDLRELVMAWAGTIYAERVVGKKESAQLDKEQAALLAALDDAWKWRTWSEEPSIEREFRRYREVQRLFETYLRRFADASDEAQRYREALAYYARSDTWVAARRGWLSIEAASLPAREALEGK